MKKIIRVLFSLILLGVLHKAWAATPVNIEELIRASNQGVAAYQSMLPEQSPMNGPVLLVSLSMPDLVLRQYLEESVHYQIPVVIRGLVNNDLKMTALRVYQLLHPENISPIPSGIAINPVLFREYRIDSVPALVIPSTDGATSTAQTFDVIYGNMPLASALEEIMRKGSDDTIRETARLLLARGSHE